MKIALALSTILCGASAAMLAQVAPSGTTGASKLAFALRYSQTAVISGGAGDQQRAIASGTLDYLTASQRLPFSLTLSGGYSMVLSGASSRSTGFENLLVAQGIVFRSSSLRFTDGISYLPQAPTTGFSGIPGTGEPNGPSSPNLPNQSILTVDTSTINNQSSGAFEHTINRAMSFTITGGADLLIYPDGNGIGTTTYTGAAGLSQRLDARNSLSYHYLYTDYSYATTNMAINTQSAMVGYTRRWTRQIDTSISAGPLIRNSSNSQTIPSTTDYSLDAIISDTYRSGSASLVYNHGTNGGGGYLIGAVADSIDASLTREYGPRTSVNFQVGYRRTAGLSHNGVTNTEFATAVAHKHLGRDFSVYGSYSLSDKSTSSSLPSNALGSLDQVISVGIEFSSTHSH